MTAHLGSNTVESSTTEMTRKPVSKTSEHRRITKPIMEKKRRARINNSLNELKVLILDALNKDPSRHSKLEKADILEMTVRHLQKLQRQQVAATIVNDASVLNKYRAGFSECANEVGRYMNNVDGFDQPIRQRILSHLNHCVNSLNQMAANAQFNIQGQKTAFPGMMPPTTNNNNNSNALHVHIPLHSGANIFGSNTSYAMNSTHDINNNRTYTSADELKPTLSTPPSSASSTSSHFAFNLQSPKTTIGPISLTTNDIFFRSKNQQHYQHQPNHFHSSSISPGSCSFSSEQLSPMGSDGDFEMAVDCTITKPRSSSSSSASSSSSSTDENVWRPW